MRNCVILGCGRSGTSMTTGLLAHSGYFMGHQVYPPNVGNPKGIFEDHDINEINEDILGQVVPDRPPVLGRWFFQDRPVKWQRWLACVPTDVAFSSPAPVVERIRELITHTPFCFKDPRFCYTLPVWRPFLADVVHVCVFRHPASTARSIHTEVGQAKYLRNFTVTLERAMQVWDLMYRHILENHRPHGEWFFAHYQQILDGSKLDELARVLGATIDRSFPDEALRRSAPEETVPPETLRLYEELCALAGYRPPG